MVGVSNSVSVAHQSAIHDEFAPLVDRGKCISRCQRNELFAPASISGLISTAVTRPFGATASAARSATGRAGKLLSPHENDRPFAAASVGCATPSGSAGHAGATANLKLTFHLDHSA